MSPCNRSRRSVLKSGAALASVGVVGSLSGCSDALTQDGETTEEGSAASGAAADIPERSNVVMSMSFEAVLGDDAVRGAVNNALSEQSSDTSMLPASVSAAFDTVEEKAGVDPRNLNDIVLFGETSENADSSEYVGWLAYTDWTQEELTSLIEEADGDSVTTEEYGGTTVYVNDNMDDSTERVAVLGDGTVVLGRKSATNDVIDVRNGDENPISGEIRSAWDATSGEYASVAMDISPEDLPDGQAEAAAPTVRDIKYAYGSVYAAGEKRGVRFNLETDSAQSAEDVKTFIEGQMALEEEKAEDQQTKEMLDSTDITTSDTTVVITNEVDIDVITPVIEQFVTLFVAQRGQSSMGAGGPSYAF